MVARLAIDLQVCQTYPRSKQLTSSLRHRHSCRMMTQIAATAATLHSGSIPSTNRSQDEGQRSPQPVMALQDNEIDFEVFRANVAICLVNNEGKVFAAQRMDDVQDTWQVPQGGIDPGEGAAEAALRELGEETSVSSATIIGEINGWLRYEFPTHIKQCLHGGWRRYQGQAQKWYLIKFTGQDSEINLETGEHCEFKTWRWQELGDLPGGVVEFKRDVYSVAVERFGPLVEGIKAKRVAAKQNTS